MALAAAGRSRCLTSMPPALRAAVFRRCFHMAPLEPKTKDILDGIFEGNRTMLARGITLVESTRLDHRAQAQSLIYHAATSMMARSQHRAQTTFRIGLSGPPGAGKSTFIETFGLHLTGLGHKVAVLAVDPSSSRTGGSILGDKTRMDMLSREPHAFIRPSPSRCTLGGVARNTNEAIVLCEAAGYDIILIETVGVGQSETTVADMVDLFTLLMPPAAGDELQGIKRGIVELAQLVLVNKADGDLLPAARRSAAEVISALKILRPMREIWNPKVVLLSAREKQGIDKAWDAMCEFREAMQTAGELERRRANQRRVHMWNYINTQILDMFQRDAGMKQSVEVAERGVVAGEVPPGAAADMLIGQFLASQSKARS